MNATVKKPTKVAAGKTAGATTPLSKKPAVKIGAAAKPATIKEIVGIVDPAPAEPRATVQAGTADMPDAAKVVTKKRAVPDTAIKVFPEDIQPGKHMSSNNANQGSGVRIDKTVVSKVREVATKTTKSAPAPTTDGALLSEAQIMKMGEKDYMSAAQLAFFKARLQQLEKDLLKNAGETTEHLRETVLVPDPADRATIEEEHALELRTRDRERKLLKKVQQSIASIDTGDYGWCEETGEPIGIPRLLARPTATLSLEAQQRRELKQKLYGD